MTFRFLLLWVIISRIICGCVCYLLRLNIVYLWAAGWCPYYKTIATVDNLLNLLLFDLLFDFLLPLHHCLQLAVAIVFKPAILMDLLLACQIVLDVVSDSKREDWVATQGMTESVYSHDGIRIYPFEFWGLIRRWRDVQYVRWRFWSLNVWWHLIRGILKQLIVNLHLTLFHNYFYFRLLIFFIPVFWKWHRLFLKGLQERN